MPNLNKKLNDVFAGYVVRKDLVKLVRGNAAVPSYVLEFLLGQNAATDDEEQIKEGVERVKDILAKHYVQRAESGAKVNNIFRSFSLKHVRQHGKMLFYKAAGFFVPLKLSNLYFQAKDELERFICLFFHVFQGVGKKHQTRIDQRVF